MAVYLFGKLNDHWWRCMLCNGLVPAHLIEDDRVPSDAVCCPTCLCKDLNDAIQKFWFACVEEYEEKTNGSK